MSSASVLDLPSVPGIDRDDVMERIGGDLDLFWELLGDLSASYRDAPARIAVGLDSSPDSARRLAHDLKAVLGNLGAVGLYPVAAELHEAIRDGRSALYPGLLGRLSAGLGTLCDAIDAARTAHLGGASSLGQAREDWIESKYAELRGALAGYRARDCRALAAELEEADVSSADRAFADRLVGLVRAYRFPEALALLECRPNR